jgi:hypothetical protein
MDGRHYTLLFLIILPAVLIGVTIWQFASNPLSVFVLLAVMLVGGLYLLSYNTSFA